MEEQDAKAWKDATARIAELDALIEPQLREIRALIEPEYSALKARITEMEDRFDDEIVSCEICSKPFLCSDQDSQYSDVGYCCPGCGQAARDEIAKCEHRLEATEDDYGDPAHRCTRCGCLTADDFLEDLLGPERYVLFQAGGLRAESQARPAQSRETLADDAGAEGGK